MKLNELLYEEAGYSRFGAKIAKGVAILGLASILLHPDFSIKSVDSRYKEPDKKIEIADTAKRTVNILDEKLSKALEAIPQEKVDGVIEGLKNFANNAKEKISDFAEQHADQREKIINGARKYYKELFNKIDDAKEQIFTIEKDKGEKNTNDNMAKKPKNDKAFL